ncbi:sensor histidine kinase [Streptomyces sp. NPDC059009]|uniref:sensor histidine kinase n=1 Tax=Streptomyces sp. NPDC059009 TaxID=3346694 RepID=UPI0036CB8F01
MIQNTLWGAGGWRGYVWGSRPWRSVVYVGGGALAGAGLLVVLVALGVLGVALSLVLVGLPLLAALALSGVPVAAVERWRVRVLLPYEEYEGGSPHRTPEEPGLVAWFRLRVGEAATWRELAYAVLLALVLWPLDLGVLACAVGLPVLLLGAPLQLALSGGGGVRPAKLWLVDGYPGAVGTALLGLVLLLVLLYPLGAYAVARAGLARLLLDPREAELAARLVEVTRSRARLVAAFEAERRRIERDLHDGAQQRLVALSMRLGLARLDAEPGSPLAASLTAAHGEAEAVLGELRELIRGIHPQVLADYGLAAAIEDTADRCVVPVTCALDLPRLPEPVESAGYFAVREALTNVDRHSGARRAGVRARHGDGVLRIEVTDDGRGGAGAGGGGSGGRGGSGLTGLADRLAVLDGTLTVASPPGGPTVLTVEIPCTP